MAMIVIVSIPLIVFYYFNFLFEYILILLIAVLTSQSHSFVYLSYLNTLFQITLNYCCFFVRKLFGLQVHWYHSRKILSKALPYFFFFDLKSIPFDFVLSLFYLIAFTFLNAVIQVLICELPSLNEPTHLFFLVHVWKFHEVHFYLHIHWVRLQGVLRNEDSS